MSVEKVKEYLDTFGFGDRIIVPEKSSATVEEAAIAIGCLPKQIAKTMSFFQGTAEGENADGSKHTSAVLIVMAGDARVDNRKYKALFHQKAKMIPGDAVEEAVGHAPGGVCPFAVKDDVKTYLDVSLKRFDHVYPAAGSDHSAVNLTVDELEKAAHAVEWIDVCKIIEG